MLLVALLLAEQGVTGFVTPLAVAPKPSSMVVMAAKKKNAGGSGGKGFGRTPVEEPKPLEEVAQSIDNGSNGGSSPFLSSVDGGSKATPQVDESIPVEQRTANLLRDQYGLRTREEQQAEEKRQEAVKEQQQKLAEWKKQADAGQDFDIMASLPPPLLIFIDRFLKAGAAICTVLFVLAGVGITVEAWSKASDSPLPENIDQFIVNVVEPNFTPGLLVLLGFSVSLGAFASAQLASASSTYREGGD